ncbi:hypothetical protein J5X98_03995 [Leptothermofonsia sichuanensis E412]|uniref:hypothetical protein n=1 Tax=Leptothermofonsia sichuanensis TaxID=2917832 RepID=UPI001CA64373|nr:hypothetical protein [Leptothermofonsia sichuanensis]QZZ21631.1 hypothetical protein J5X98_03995 [Leptothermofonsia sichuanensis E412]
MKYVIPLALSALSIFGFATAVSAENFTVECTSTSQLCDRIATLNFNSDGPGIEYAVTLKAPRTHCSAVRYLVYSNDGNRRLLGRTTFLNAGESSCVFLGNNYARGSQSVLIGAEGWFGGCNTGRLHSWGVDAHAYPVPR